VIIPVRERERERERERQREGEKAKRKEGRRGSDRIGEKQQQPITSKNIRKARRDRSTVEQSLITMDGERTTC
jgi:DNA invertase Pin-like site-specific DNA recombinase